MKRYFSGWAFAVLLGTTVAACAPTPRQEGTGEFIDDSVITTKVKGAILDDAILKVNEIHVDTYKGVVHLTGTVGNERQIAEATDVASRVAGVKSVRNELHVQ